MAVTSRHIMESNQRLLRQIEKDLFADADKAWVRVYSSFCKRQGALNPDNIMQFKYKGEQYKLEEDVLLRSGVKPLHKELEAEFKEAYAMFVEELDEEKRILQNMMSKAIRIAKYAEDLIEILPEILHESVHEAGFFQAESKPLMTVEQAESFKEEFSPYFDIFDMRKTIGAIM